MVDGKLSFKTLDGELAPPGDHPCIVYENIYLAVARAELLYEPTYGGLRREIRQMECDTLVACLLDDLGAGVLSAFAITADERHRSTLGCKTSGSRFSDAGICTCDDTSLSVHICQGSDSKKVMASCGPTGSF